MNEYLEPFKTSGYVLLSIVMFVVWVALFGGPFILFVAGASAAGNEGGITIPFVTSGWWMLSPLAYFITIPLALAIETAMGWTLLRMKK